MSNTSSISLDNLLEKLQEKEEITKEAGEMPIPKSEESIAPSLKGVLNNLKTNTSKEQAEMESLKKMASEITSQDEDAQLRQAKLYGTRMADGFVERITEYEKSAALLAEEMSNGEQIKIASDLESDEIFEEFEKYASENPEEAERLFAMGQEQAHKEMASDKNASENPEEAEGQEQAHEEMASEKTASEDVILEKFASENPEETEKALSEGYNTVISELDEFLNSLSEEELKTLEKGL